MSKLAKRGKVISVKIGIITWFNGSNYGTNLQAIALQKYLRNGGYEVQIINFEIGIAQKEGLISKICRQPEKYLSKYYFKKFKKDIEERDDKFKKTVQKYCIFTSKIKNTQEYIDICNTFDLIICGSDQIWNPNGYHKFYYADFPQIKAKKISYAPSLGVNNIKPTVKAQIKNSLSTFIAISVREENGAELLGPLSPVKPEVVLDPTFLLSREEWSHFATAQNIAVADEYVLSMFLTDNPNHWKAAQRFAQERKMAHVIVPYRGISYIQPGQICANAGLEDLLALIRDAKYILTDSFHITVFSLIFNRPFYVFQRFKENKFTSQNARIINLLNLSKTNYRLIAYGEKKVPQIKNINYEIVNKELGKKIGESKTFLQKSIKIC